MAYFTPLVGIVLTVVLVIVTAAATLGGVYGADHHREALRRSFVNMARAPLRDQDFRFEPPVGETRGIVIVAGGKKYGPLALRSVQRIRALCGPVSVEVFGLDKKELSHASMRTLGQMPGVQVRSLDMKKKFSEKKRTLGFAAKSEALLRSSFRYAFLLDADNEPMGDIMHLFDSVIFQQTGFITWPDVVPLHRNTRYLRNGVRDHIELGFEARTLEMLGIYDEKLLEQESGQLMVDRGKHRATIQRAVWLNRQRQLTYKFTFGDKETYQLAALLENSPHYTVQHRPAVGGTLDSRGRFQSLSLMQRHPVTGVPLFCHRCGTLKKHVEAPITHLMTAPWSENFLHSKRGPRYEKGRIVAHTMRESTDQKASVGKKNA